MLDNDQTELTLCKQEDVYLRELASLLGVPYETIGQQYRSGNPVTRRMREAIKAQAFAKPGGFSLFTVER